MTTETRRRHTREFVETLLGPAIYLVYFVMAYGASSVACALGEGSAPMLADGAAVVRNVVLVFTLAALGAVALVAVLAARRLAPSRGGNARAEDDQDLFMALLTLALALLSALAILWTGIATLLVSACA